MEPYGDMSFAEAYRQFAEIMAAGEAAGADLVLIETMSDLLEAKRRYWPPGSGRLCR